MTEEEDLMFDAILEKSLRDMGKEMKKQQRARCAKGIPDITHDTSPERQNEVMARLQEEIEKQRPHIKRLLYGKEPDTCSICGRKEDPDNVFQTLFKIIGVGGENTPIGHPGKKWVFCICQYCFLERFIHDIKFIE
ncbi:MAG TPA: hypothetical protein VGJ93_01815 [Desulfuromonadaceae bacterium]|jgi:hypothetical protein